MPKSTQCRILKSIAKYGNTEVRPPLKDIQVKKRMEWVRNHVKVNVQSLLFTDECRAPLDRPNEWSGGWYCGDGPRPHRIRFQQGPGGVVFWGVIIGNELVESLTVAKVVKMTVKL